MITYLRAFFSVGIIPLWQWCIQVFHLTPHVITIMGSERASLDHPSFRHHLSEVSIASLLRVSEDGNIFKIEYSSPFDTRTVFIPRSKVETIAKTVDPDLQLTPDEDKEVFNRILHWYG